MESRNKFVLIVLSIISIILIGITSFNDSIISPLRQAVGIVLLPVQSGVNTAGRAVYDNIEEQRKIHSAITENIELNKKIDELTQENTKLMADNGELARLRELYKLDESYSDYPKVGARVVAKDSTKWFSTFTIDKGSDDGIAVDMNVIGYGGLIGIVTDVGKNYATVRAVIDDISRVSAMSLRTGALCRVDGNLEQYNEGRLILRDVKSDADVNEGDMIVTSNVSTKYLPNILIGYARDLKDDSSRLTKSGYIIPVVNFDTISEVLVITKLKEVSDQ
ncbi:MULTISPECIES: rod shape-determining protein MreC [Lachnoanaerobaculum]|jgi:rod shape-determining protein mreC|uniref:Cell shape-determining protein MreC n=2 Tax=Lachnoanaerobaculum TaxID=1164882 RepID=A0A133ZDJ1_9FIRM|nr:MULTISPECIES: rod shape-determining protein MreC [Lachnoanaerobaculum]EHO53415.1 rod shape-determining protein MreC [Lachnospiraceae bacterium oral taxon 082 str. F0431]MBF1010189.1 rod shape-determining protein MreC [Lachnoanaerobaculum sp.]MBS6729474.1 rod shape-determining protein MreC [Lachnospiraceae bacterium oral taxon 082]MDU5596693.1 rod shape-determining protein MreC [Lachnospiraceae bacterium]KXB53501.1 rod shape-determining protein MreC [Lachnoanaerobaculum saburreum]